MSSCSNMTPNETSQPTSASISQAASKPGMFGVRHLQVALTTLCVISNFALRVNISVAIVAMVDNKHANPDFPEYDWTIETQSLVLSGMAWGLVILQIPGGLLAERYGPKHLLTVNMVVTALFGILTPVAASIGGWGLVFACRFIQGLAQGLLYPATLLILARWVPVAEKGLLVTIVFAGIPIGVGLALAAGGVLSTSTGGWPSTFYVSGGLTLTIAVLWMLLGSNSPVEDRFVSAEERAYIEDSLRTNEKQAKPLKTPWKIIMTSLPVWATVVAHSGLIWSYYILNTETPTYMNAVLGYDLNANGLLSSLPYVIEVLVGILTGVLSDYLTNNGIISVAFSRKLFNSIAFWVPGAALIWLGFTQDATLANILLCIAVSLNGATNVGFIVNVIDLAPNFAGTLFGLGSSIGYLVSCFGPLIVGTVVTEKDSVAQWRIVFLITAGIYFFAGLFFAIFAQGHQQPWNDPPNIVESVDMTTRSVESMVTTISSLESLGTPIDSGKSVEINTYCGNSERLAAGKGGSVEMPTKFVEVRLN